MKNLALSIFVLLSFDFVGYNQNMSKDEIRIEWLKSSFSRSKDSVLSKIMAKEVRYKHEIQTTLRILKENNIDTIGLLQFSSTGSTRETDGAIFYLIWQSKGKYYFNYYSKKNTYSNELLEQSHFIEYFKKNHNDIINEFLIPPIYSARRSGGKVEFDGKIVIHEKHYTIYCQLGEIFKVIEFGSSFINDKKSLFYFDNLSTFSYELFLIADAEMKMSLRLKSSKNAFD